MEFEHIKAVTEGLLFASGDEGVTIKQLSQVLEISDEKVRELIDSLRKEYDNVDRGLMVLEANEILYLTTKPEHSSFYKKLVETPQSAKMSQAALETLAIIAYRQPITRAEIEEIRGINSDGPVKTLINRYLIEEAGRKDAVGRPVLFRTTKEFLTYFGLTSLDELPPLPETETEETNQEIDLFFERFNEDLDE